MFTVHLAKEPFKFSCSHFTILAPDHAERLHGHNYQVRVDIAVEKLNDQLGLAFDFNLIKPKIRMICDEMDERILLPKKSPYLKMTIEADQVAIGFNNKRYSFPAEDCLILPITNITSEELARHVCERLAQSIATVPYWTSISVNIEETRGQSVSYSRQR